MKPLVICALIPPLFLADVNCGAVTDVTGGGGPGGTSATSTGSGGAGNTGAAGGECGTGTYDGVACTTAGETCAGTGTWSTWKCTCASATSTWSCVDLSDAGAITTVDAGSTTNDCQTGTLNGSACTTGGATCNGTGLWSTWKCTCATGTSTWSCVDQSDGGTVTAADAGSTTANDCQMGTFNGLACTTSGAT